MNYRLIIKLQSICQIWQGCNVETIPSPIFMSHENSLFKYIETIAKKYIVPNANINFLKTLMSYFWWDIFHGNVCRFNWIYMYDYIYFVFWIIYSNWTPINVEWSEMLQTTWTIGPPWNNENNWFNNVQFMKSKIHNQLKLNGSYICDEENILFILSWSEHHTA